MSREKDEKVVEMRFDNKQFEQGVKQTRDSIQKLKSDLDFSDVNSKISGFQRVINTISIAKIAKSTDQLAKRFSFLGESIDSVKHKLAGGLFNSVTAAFNQMKTGGWSRSLNIANAEFQIKGLKKDWDALQKDIDYGVKDTAYGFDEAAKAAAQFAASGLDAGQQMKTALRGISGVAAMTNSSYSDIANIFTTISGNGRLMADQLNQMSSRGLNAAATLADYFNSSSEKMQEFYELYNKYKTKSDEGIVKGSKATEKAIRTMTSRGAIDFKTFSDAMDQAFGEHAKEGNKTFVGSLSNMKAALSRIGAEVTGPLQNGMITVFNDLRVIFNTIHKVAQPVLDDLAKAISFVLKEGGPVDKVLKGINSVLETMYDKGEKLQEQIHEITGTTTEDLQKIGKAIHDVMMGVYGNGDKRKDLLKAAGLDYATIQGGVNQVMLGGKTIEEVLKSMEQTASTTGQTFKEVVNQATDMTKEEKAALELRHNIEMIHSAGNNFADGFKTIGKATVDILKKIWQAFTDVFDKPSFDKLNDFAEGFKKFTEEMYPTEKRLNNIQRTFRGLFSIIDMGARIIGAFLSGLFKLHKNVDDLGGGLLGVTGFLGDLLYKLDQATKKGHVFSKVFGGIGTFLSNAFTKIHDFFTKVNEDAAKSGIGTKVADGFKTFGKAVVKVFGAIGLAFKSLGEWAKKTGIGPAVLNALSIAAQTLGKVIEFIAEKIENFVKKVKNSPLTAKLVDDFTESVTKLSSKVKELKLSDIKLPKFYEIAENIYKFNKKIKKFFSDIFNSTNGMVFLADTTKKFEEFTGILGVFSSEGKKAAPVLASVSDAYSGIFKKVNSKDGTDAKKNIKSFGDTIKDFVSNAGEKLKSFISWMKENFNWKEIFKTAQAFIALSALNNVSKAVKSFGSVMGGVGTLLEGVGKGVWKFLISAGKSFENISKGVKSYLRGQGLKAATSGILAIAGAILAMAGALKIISTIDEKSLKRSLVALSVIVGELIALSVVVGKFTKTVKPTQFMALATVFITIGIAMEKLAKAIQTVATIGDGKKIAQATGAIALLLGEIMGFMVILNGGFSAGKLTIKAADASGMKTTVASFVAIATGLQVMTGVIMSFAKMSRSDFRKGWAEMSITLATLTAAMIAINRFGKGIGKDQTLAFANILGLVAAVAGLSLVVKTLGKMNEKEFKRGIDGMRSIMLSLAAMFITMNYAFKDNIIGQADNLKQAAKAIVSIGASVLLIALALHTISKIEGPDLIKSVLAVTALIVALTASVGYMNKLTDGVHGVGDASKTLAAIGGAIAAISVAVLALSTINPGKMAAATTAISVLLLALGKSVSWMSKGKKQVMTMKSLAIILLSFAGIIVALAALPMDRLIAVSASLSAILLSMAALMHSIGMIGDVSAKDVAKFAVISAIVTALMGCIAVIIAKATSLGGDPTQYVSLVKATATFSLAMIPLMFALNQMAKTGADTGKILKLTGILAIIGGVIGEMGLILVGLSKLPSDTNKFVPIISGIGAMLAEMVTLMVPIIMISQMNVDTGRMFKLTGMFALIGGILGELGIVISAISMIPSDTDKFAPILKGIGAMLIELAGVITAITIISKIPGINIGKMVAVSGVLYVCSGVLGAVGLILAALSDIPSENMDNYERIAKTVTKTCVALIPMIAAAAAIGKFGAAGPTILGAASVLGSMAIFLVGVPMIFEALGGIINAINHFAGEGAAERTIQTALNVLHLIITGIAQIAADAIDIVSSSVIKQITNAGLALQVVALGIQSILETCKGLKKEDVETIRVIGDFMKAISDAAKESYGYDEKTKQKVDYIAEFLPSFKRIGEALNEFNETTSGIDPTQIQAVTRSAYYIGTLIEAISNAVSKGIDYTDYDAQLDDITNVISNSFGPMINSVSSLDENKVDKTVSVIKQLKKLVAPLQEFHDLAGDGDFSLSVLWGLFKINDAAVDYNELGKQISDFCISMYSSISTIGSSDIDENTYKTGIDRISAMQNITGTFSLMQGFMPEIDSFLTWWNGRTTFKSMTWSDFGNDLSSFVIEMLGSFNVIGSSSSVTEETINSAVNKINLIGKTSDALSSLKTLIPEVTSVKSFFAGKEMNWSDFGEDLSGLINSIANVSTTGQIIDEAGMNMVVEACKKMALTLNFLKNFDGDKAEKDGKSLYKFAESVKNFFETLAEIKDAKNAEDTLDNLKQIISSMSNYDFGSELQNGSKASLNSSNFTDTMKQLTDNVDKMLKSVDSTSKYPKEFNDAGSNLIKSFADGFKDNDSLTKIQSAINVVTNKASSSAKDAEVIKKIKKAGNNFAQGFINGIKEKVNNGDVAEAGTALGNSAYKAAKKALDEHSPSKKMYQVGAYAVEGFVNGIKLNGDWAVRSVGETMLSLVSYLKNGIGAQADFSHQFIFDSTAVGYLADNMKLYKDGIISYAQALNEAKSTVLNFATSLYANSDAYQEDQKNLKNAKENYEDAVVSYKEAQENVKKASKDTKEQAVNDLKNAETAMNDAKKSVNDALNSIVDHVKKAYEELHSNISSMISDFTSIETAISKTQTIDIFGTNSAYQTKKQNEKELASVEEEIAQARSDLAAAQAKSDAVQGRSKIALDEITEAQDRLNTALERQQELIKSNDSSESAQTLLDNMKANVDQYRTWLNELSDLESIGLSSEALQTIKNQGIQGAEQVKTIWNAVFQNGFINQDFVNQFNSLFGEKQSLELQGFKMQLRDSEDDIENWKNKLLEAKNAGFDQGLLISIAKLGPSNQTQLDMILRDYNTYGNRSVTLWNNKFKTTYGNADYWASQIMGIISGLNDKIAETNSALSALENRSAAANSSTLSLERGTKKSAIRIADAYAQGFEKSLQIASPSKRFARIGKFVALGFANGIKSQSDKVDKASNVFTNSPVSAIESAMAQAKSLLSGDIDPTIRPMIDLTNIQNGSNQIHSMFDGMSLQTQVAGDFAYKVDNADQYAPNNIMARYIKNRQPETVNNDSHMEQQNTFNITGDNPKEIANQIDVILAQKARRKRESWA